MLSSLKNKMNKVKQGGAIVSGHRSKEKSKQRKLLPRPVTAWKSSLINVEAPEKLYAIKT